MVGCRLGWAGTHRINALIMYVYKWRGNPGVIMQSGTWSCVVAPVAFKCRSDNYCATKFQSSVFRNILFILSPHLDTLNRHKINDSIVVITSNTNTLDSTQHLLTHLNYHRRSGIFSQWQNPTIPEKAITVVLSDRPWKIAQTF